MLSMVIGYTDIYYDIVATIDGVGSPSCTVCKSEPYV